MPDELIPSFVGDYIRTTFGENNFSTRTMFAPWVYMPILRDWSAFDMPVETEPVVALKILDKDGNEHEPVVGMLVMHKTGCCHNTLSRITSILPARTAKSHIVYLKPLHGREDHSVYLSDVVLVSAVVESVPCEDKSPPLIDRIDNLHKNLYRAIDRLNSGRGAVSRSDRNLLDKLYRIVTLYDVPNQHRWFWATVAESLDDPRKISYAPSIELSDDNKRRRKCGISRLLKSKADDYGFHFTSTEADRIGYLIGVHFPSCYNYKMNILTGMDIHKVYTESPDSWNSCMKGRPYVKWYSANPEKVSLVEVVLGDLYEGRALLWNTDQGTKVLDRVYPSDNGPHTLALHNMCEQNGWDYKTIQGPDDGYLKSDRMDYTVTMSCKETRTWSRRTGYPYMDTFKYTDNCLESDNDVVLRMDDGERRLICTGGGWESNDRDDEDDEYDSYCNSCDCGLYDDDVFRNPNGMPLCESCFDDRYIELAYRTADGSRYVGGAYSLEDACPCYQCGEGRLIEHITNVEGRDFCNICLPIQTGVCGTCGETKLICNIATTLPTILCDTCDDQRMQRANTTTPAEACRLVAAAIGTEE